MNCLVQVLRGLAHVVLSSPGLQVSSAALKSVGQGKLGRDTLNSVSRVDVLDEGNLEAGGTALSGDDGGVSQEVFPDLYA